LWGWELIAGHIEGHGEVRLAGWTLGRNDSVGYWASHWNLLFWKIEEDKI